MRILAIETSGGRGGIALLETPETHGPRADPAVLEELYLGEGLRHGRDLVPAIRDACGRAGWDRRHIDLVAVSIGPGSFTGIRIAVTLTKVMAFDTGAKVVAVPSLRALAHNAPADRRRVAAIVDAKRGGLFASVFERRGQGDAIRAPADSLPAPGVSRGAKGHDTPASRRGLVTAMLNEFAEVFGPALIEPEDLARRLAAPAFVLGHGITKGRAALAGFELAPQDLWDVRPGIIGRLGAELFDRGQAADPLRLEPIYIRPPEAQEIWQRRRGAGA
jgi:tRNA threonylcarbamoyladenosine biosynthesis protein TsaB